MKQIHFHGQTLVAMSGGVDSSVAALLLKKAGVPAIGVSMQVWDYRKNGGCDSKATCCSPDDFTDARKVAAAIGLPYYVFDLEETFHEEVIAKFVRTYESGQTPNPCIDCNSRVKFRKLRERALSFGCEAVATGHYARVEKREDGYHLLRGVDRNKDQSYFLYNLQQSELRSTVFPVGEMTKDEVRELAKEAGLATASKPESQDICFVSGNVQDFLVKLGGKRPAGRILSSLGEVLGAHDGIHQFTVGQRRGIGIGGQSDPLYVTDIQPDTNVVVVGPKAELERRSCRVLETNLVSPHAIESLHSNGKFEFDAIVQLRHRHQGVAARVCCFPDGSSEILMEEHAAAVTPGQAAVFYDPQNVELIGGGRISRNTYTQQIA